MAHVEQRSKGWRVRWYDRVVTVDEHGQTSATWRDRARTFPTRKEAELFATEVTVKARRGEDTRHFDTREVPVTTLGAVGRAYIAAAASSPPSTYRYRKSFTNSWIAFAGDTTPASDLTRSLVERYAESLPADGRKAATRHRKVLLVQQLWEWAADRPERFPGVPPARRVTGRSSDVAPPPPPVVAADAPTWQDMDAMVGELTQRTWHRRLGLFLRYTGVRVGQALNLAWRDVDLAGGVLRLRAGVQGAKKSPTRVVPLHPRLAADMAPWRGASPWVFPHFRDPKRPWQPGAAVEPFARAWEKAGVARTKWDLPEDDLELVGDRSHGSPTHAFRRGVKVELLRSGVEARLVDYLTGHKTDATIAAYVPEAAPTASPYWARLVEAVEKIPPYEGPTG